MRNLRRPTMKTTQPVQELGLYISPWNEVGHLAAWAD